MSTAGDAPEREPAVSGDARRTNEARFTQTAAQYAASRIGARQVQSEALLRLTAPRSDDLALDVACGPGALLAALAPRIRLAIGLDLTMAMLREARSRIGRGDTVSIVRGAAERLPFPDGTFSLVTCTWAFHHFGAPAEVLGEMVRVSARGGRVAIGDLVGAEDDAARARQNAIERLRDPAHVELRSPSGLRALMVAAGLNPTAMEGGTEPREVGEWCRLSDTPPDVARQVREMLIASQPGDLAGMSPAIIDGQVRFVHRWVIVTADRR
ncbi:MAG TPA: class I SAM-dependent methyltransferase [bacterium]|nr:class I SAM-dependent methyltransferase [bacterium]